MLAGKLAQEGKGFFIVIAQCFGGDQLCAGQSGAGLRTDLAKRGVGDAGHGGQSQFGMNLYIADPHAAPSFRVKIQFIISQTA